MLFVEELNANDVEPRMLENFAVNRTVRDIKKAIAQEIGQPSIWESLQVLFVGDILDNLSRTLDSYGIVNGDTIYYVRSIQDALPPPYPGIADKSEKKLANLFFLDLQGKTQNLHDVPIDSPVKEVIQRYGSEKAVEVEWLRFLWSNKQIWPTDRGQNDNRTLKDYGLQEGSTIHVTARLRGGNGTLQ